ncbi:MAG: hypothetical protein ABR511_06050 [Acidimicrobiales bacterium]
MAMGAAACGSGRAKALPHATVPTATEQTTTTNPYVVPATIDAAYVNRVLVGLNMANGDTLRLVMRTRGITQEVIDRLQAIYQNRDDVNLQLQSLQYQLRQAFSGMSETPGAVRTAVTDVIDASPACIFVQVSFDDSALRAGQAAAPRTEWIGLAPIDPSRDPNHYDPTPWVIATEGISVDGKAPPNPCTAPA